jgi:hypothetical protein
VAVALTTDDDEEDTAAPRGDETLNKALSILKGKNG